jgi:trigger factor
VFSAFLLRIEEHDMADETRSEPEAGTAPTATEPETAEAEKGEAKEQSKLHQAVEMTDIGPCKKHIKVTIERDDIERMLNDKYSKLVVDASVPGFRPGKAPRKSSNAAFTRT